MLTRTFLFLLAMVTGLSAPQMANAAQVTPATVGACATSQAAVIAYAAVKSQYEVASTFLEDRTDFIFVGTDVPSVTITEDPASSPRTYRSDRSRE